MIHIEQSPGTFHRPGLIVCPCSATPALLRATLPLMVLSADLKRSAAGHKSHERLLEAPQAARPVTDGASALSLKQQRINGSARGHRAGPQGRLQAAAAGRVIIQDSGGARQEAGVGRLGRENGAIGLEDALMQQPTLMGSHVPAGNGRTQTAALTGLFDIRRSAKYPRSRL